MHLQLLEPLVVSMVYCLLLVCLIRKREFLYSHCQCSGQDQDQLGDIADGGIVKFNPDLKVETLQIGYAAIELWSALSSRGDGVAHVAHLGGMLFGYFLIKIWRKTSDTFNGWDGYEIR